EQCVQIVRLTSTLAALSAAASTLPMPPYGSWLADAPAPGTRRERFKNVRRSIPATGTPVRRRRRGPAAATFAFFLVSSMILPPPGVVLEFRTAVIIADVRRLAITRIR